jgi:hypothetical protein
MGHGVTGQGQQVDRRCWYADARIVLFACHVLSFPQDILLYAPKLVERVIEAVQCIELEALPSGEQLIYQATTGSPLNRSDQDINMAEGRVYRKATAR